MFCLEFLPIGSIMLPTSNFDDPSCLVFPAAAARCPEVLVISVSKVLRRSLKESSKRPAVSAFLVFAGVTPILLGEEGALEPGGRESRFSCCAVGDLKFEVRCVLVVGTPFVPSSAELRRDEKGSVDSGWAR